MYDLFFCQDCSFVPFDVRGELFAGRTEDGSYKNYGQFKKPKITVANFLEREESNRDVRFQLKDILLSY